MTCFLAAAKTRRWLLCSSLGVCICIASSASAESPNAAAEPFAAEARSPLFGTAHPFVYQAGSFRFGWVAGCQSRHDTDGDGQIKVHLGRHGEVFGDRAQLYLFTSDGTEQAIDDYISRSPSGRYVAFRQSKKLIVLDTKTHARTDLSDFGAKMLDDADDQQAPFDVAFSFGHWVVFRRSESDVEVVVALNLETQRTTELYRSPARIVRFWFDPEGRELVIAEVQRDSPQNAKKRTPYRVMTNLAGYHCRGPVGAYTVLGHAGEKPKLHRVSIESLEDHEELEEQLGYALGCIHDGRRVVVGSNPFGYLVGGATPVGFDEPERGPVQWVRSLSAPQRRLCRGDQKGGHDVKPLKGGSRHAQSPQWTGGFNAFVGLWHFDLEPLNRALAADGYTSSGTAHAVFGGDLWARYGRISLGLVWLGVNSKNVSAQYNAQWGGEVLGLGGGLSFGVEALRTSRVSASALMGIKAITTEIEFDSTTPPLAPHYKYNDTANINADSFLTSIAARLDIRLLDLGSPRQWVNVGADLGYEYQFARGGWFASRDNHVLGPFDGPKLDLSGPVLLLRLGVTGS